MAKRIVEDKVDVNYDVIQTFFEERGLNKKLSNKYNYVLFQDDCPDLAVLRDKQEKEKVSQKLDLKPGQRVLDIGCGIGRWGELLLEKGLYYVGIDGSPNMIERAEENLKAYFDKKLIVGIFQNFLKVLKDAGETDTFDVIFVNGVFMYLNDEDYKNALRDIHSICSDNCQLYFKESMGIEKRLTLDEIYSDSLTQNYSAIYRSIEEYRESFQKEFSGDFHLVIEEQLFAEELTNHKETIDYYFIWRR
jgi:cyclopropane fatty-acyl-phospholipid synthase-like methyltransferase